LSLIFYQQPLEFQKHMRICAPISFFLSKQQRMEQLLLAYELNDHLAQLNLRCRKEPENFVNGKSFTVKLDDLSIWPKIGHHFAHWLLANLTDEMDLVQNYVVGSLFTTATCDFVFAIKHNDCWSYSGQIHPDRVRDLLATLDNCMGRLEDRFLGPFSYKVFLQ
jgi:hypothetical protein